MYKLDKLGSDGKLYKYYTNRDKMYKLGYDGGPNTPRHNPTIRIPRPFHLKL